MFCILNHLFASLRVEDDSVKITGAARLYTRAFKTSIHAGLQAELRYLSGIKFRYLS